MGGGDVFPFVAMVVTQVGYAGMNIISKLAMDAGLNPFVLVAYRQLFATLAIAPFAFFFERKTRPKITLQIFFQLFLSSILGVSVNQMTYFIGLKNSTPTIACALSNLLPAVTFLLAIPFRLESAGIKRLSGQAKVIGTVLCVGGAMLLSFYHGHSVNIGNSSIHWKVIEENNGDANPNNNGTNFILGPFLLIVSTISWAAWFIIQAKMSETFAAPYTSSALICLMASFQCGIIGFCVEHDIAAWSLSSGIRALSCLYAGIVCSALAFCLMSWCIQKKGPLYTSVFSPLLLVIVAIVSWALLEEKLFIGTVLGSLLIVMGLYGVLWGKNKEEEAKSKNKKVVEEAEEGVEKEMPNSTTTDLELQLPVQ